MLTDLENSFKKEISALKAELAKFKKDRRMGCSPINMKDEGGITPIKGPIPNNSQQPSKGPPSGKRVSSNTLNTF